MLTRKFAALISISCLIVSVFWGLIGFSQSPQSSIQLTTEPPITDVQPRRDLVHLSLKALSSSGQSLKDAKFHLQLLTPPKNPWFTTDFPIVEGTKLLDMEVNAPEGVVNLQQVFPIRGTYKLLVEVTSLTANAFDPIQQTLAIAVPENFVKYRNLLILAVVLFAVGLGGGRIIGQQQPIQPGEIAPQRVRLLLSSAIIVAIAVLLVVNISAELTHLHSHDHQVQASEPSVKSQGLDLKLSGDNHATVGQLASLEIQAIDTTTGQPVKDVIFKVKTTQLEENELVFAYQVTPDAAGKVVWQQQFFDGAPHKVEVEVAPQPTFPRQFNPFHVSQEVEVDGVAPPLLTRFISLIYFTSIVVVGLILGLWQQQRRNRKALMTRHSHG